MRSVLSRIRNCLLEEPAAKAATFALLTAGYAVLSGAFVVDITTPKGLDWTKTGHVWTFYALTALIIIQFVYQRAVYLHDTDVMKFTDADYCIAYMRQQCMPEVAKQWKEKIRNGQGDELKELMDMVRKALR